MQFKKDNLRFKNPEIQIKKDEVQFKKDKVQFETKSRHAIYREPQYIFIYWYVRMQIRVVHISMISAVLM